MSLRRNGWYDLPGYSWNSPELVLTGLHHLTTGQTIRIWYGEDLYDRSEHDNHGFTCIDVHIFCTHYSEIVLELPLKSHGNDSLERTDFYFLLQTLYSAIVAVRMVKRLT